MLQRVNAVAVIRRGGKFLVLRRSMWSKFYQRQWQFPEGGVEFGESPEQALARELKEETGLKLKKAKLLGVRSNNMEYFGKSVWHFIRIFYDCKVSGELKLSGKHDSYKWLSKRQLKNVHLLKGFKLSDVKELL
jgi:8-oxo-dGTP pyrophosphatase MutT (NUDIX family)